MSRCVAERGDCSTYGLPPEQEGDECAPDVGEGWLSVGGGGGIVEAMGGLTMGRLLAVASFGAILEFTPNSLFSRVFFRVFGYSHITHN